MSDQVEIQKTSLARPTTNDPQPWKVYWKSQGQAWRTEPQIHANRQKYLNERRSIKSNTKEGFYPFKGVKLSRADVEWLLATHENGRGPVYWNDASQREREGIDLRGADLRQIDLSKLPLARMCGGLTWEEWGPANEEQRNMAAVYFERACLDKAHLEGADLASAHLEGADFYKAHLEEAALDGAYCEGVDFIDAHLERAYLSEAHLEGTLLEGINLEGTRLYRINLCNKERVGPWVENVRWSDANLTVVNWSQIKMLGEEYEALKFPYKENLWRYEIAVRANRQLAVALQLQGLNENAAYFAYRAQKLQRVILRREKKFASYLFSGFLDVLAGYGHKPIRSVLWYLIIIIAFTTTYYAFGHLPFFPDAFVFSLTSFHGRGFFPGLGSETSLHNPLVVLAALEAVIGLFIEISFIATFTKRFFGS